MGLGANRPVTSLRIGNQAVPKTKGPEITWLTQPWTEMALPTSAGSLSQVGSSAHSENWQAGDLRSSPSSPNQQSLAFLTRGTGAPMRI